MVLWVLEIAVVQGCGYADINRKNFRKVRLWRLASPLTARWPTPIRLVGSSAALEKRLVREYSPSMYGLLNRSETGAHIQYSHFDIAL